MDFTLKATELVDKMTLEEKASQLRYDAPPIERLGIPRYHWWNEALHGLARTGTATMFPQAIGLAAMFDSEAMLKIGDIIATEARAKYNEYSKEEDRDIYKGLTLWAPNINIFRDPRWGRGQETYGEDPYLTSELGKSFIQGLQGSGKYLKTAACAKHFAVHSGPEELRHEFNAVVSDKDLWETYLPAFEVCVKEARVESVMGAYNRTNGEPCCASKLLMQDILKDKWGFEGYYVSDCFALADFHEHHKVTSTPQESAALALKMGCDINCGNIYLYILQAYEQGLVTEEEITEAAVHAMRTRLRLGLFSDDCEYDRIAYDKVACKEHREAATLAAEKSVVLLKNEGILPLPKNTQHIAVIGPNADSRTALIGNYVGTPTRYITILEGIESVVDETTRIYYSEGCHIIKDKVEPRAMPHDRTSEAVKIAKRTGLAIVCVGLDGRFEGEQVDNGNPSKGNELMKADKSMDLPASQIHLLKAVIETGVDIIVVNLTGSAMNLKWLQDTPNVKGIIQGWYPGSEGGLAIAKILFGEVNPSGKLPVTFYEREEDLPDFLDYSMKNRTYRYFEGKPLYPFGYGLSYTGFEYSNLRTELKTEQDLLQVEVEVQNTGEYDGDEIVQVYMKDLESKHAVRNHNLCAFERISLSSKEKKTIKLKVDKKAFEIVDDEGNRYIDSKRFKIYVGGSQPDQRSVELLGRKPLEVEIII
ncbi:glycoside hydrolase family 3 C-terminal domain-containing protein [Mobilitalea sibirica]|uniref:Glycoside hydrolase family 3 C-terminal domain-containing protein n=1 Tax=Mobilitalea sibirica TaxID=1462919 RepID=A0A8J7H0D9_9FIRM|nr:glycoside hydrolase family 3 C-terminal domain-containing protein [Mobilitalea sibirica]MBH1939497.1 glycoside hydrolase family 3 C-terminal domain-containing protein [Mobilitalea sibirica]